MCEMPAAGREENPDAGISFAEKTSDISENVTKKKHFLIVICVDFV